MARLEIVFLDVAKADFREAFDWHQENRSTQVARKFALAVGNALDQIALFPRGCPIFQGRRKAHRASRISLLALLHRSRRPCSGHCDLSHQDRSRNLLRSRSVIYKSPSPGTPEGAHAQIAEDRSQAYGYEKSLVLRAGGVAESGSPDVLRKVESKKTEKETGHLEPKNSAEAAEGAQEASHSPSGSSGHFVGFRGILGLRDVAWVSRA